MVKEYNHYDRPRRALVEAIANSPLAPSLKELSLALGCNHAYLQQYLERWSPEVLPEGIRHRLAEMLDIPHESLMPDKLKKQISKSSAKKIDADAVHIPILDHPAHSALVGLTWQVSACFLHEIMESDIVESDKAKLALVRPGDAGFAPNITPHDYIIINRTDTHPHKAGVFAVDAGDHIKFRFIELTKKGGDEVFLRHATASKGGFTQDLASVKILGRAVWKFCVI